jgi:predicted transcriptional regulator of viral defense system
VKLLDAYLDDQLSRGRGYLVKAEAMKALGLSPTAFAAAAARLIRKRRLLRPKRGFYLIVRPEDRAAGAPDPTRWIDPLMRHLGVDYRISLLRAAAFHGASHQAAQVVQVIVPKQIRLITIGRQRIQFVYQTPAVFAKTNQAPWLGQLKTDAGFAKVAGIELVLLDAVRYFHQAAGLNGAAQVVHDLGARADPRRLARAAAAYENSTARRLGYLLEHFDHARQASALRPFAKEAKSVKPLDPSVKRLAALGGGAGKSREAPTWKLSLNVPLEIDA